MSAPTRGIPSPLAMFSQQALALLAFCENSELFLTISQGKSSLSPPKKARLLRAKLAHPNLCSSGWPFEGYPRSCAV